MAGKGHPKLTSFVVKGTSGQYQPQSTDVDYAFNFIRQGSMLTKVRSKLSKNERYFQVENDGNSLKYRRPKNAECASKKEKRISISDIEEVRPGSGSDTFFVSFNKKTRDSLDLRSFTLIIGNNKKTLDLVTATVEERDLWVAGIEECRRRHEANATDPKKALQIWGRELFQAADKDGNNKLSTKEVTRLLSQMNLAMEVEEVARRINYQSLSFDEFLRFFADTLKKKEIEDLFSKYDKGRSYWTKHELHEFLTEDQKEKVSVEVCEKLIEENENCPNLKSKHWLSLAGFTGFFDSERMDIKDPSCRKVYQDMKQPLSHYFIDSSHNTYLESDQLRGSSKIECYINALKSGCRCVEMDVWDGPNNEPIVYHGHTLTSKIQFVDIVNAVNKYAFSKSKYPLIVSIENHCSMEQQRRMAHYIKTIFKEKLFLDEVVPNSNYLPSPSQMMERIVIKCKKIRELPKQPSEDDDDDDDDDDDEAAKNEQQLRLQDHQQQDIAKEFSDCIHICQNGTFKSFPDSAKNQNFRIILSLSEKKAQRLAKVFPEDFIQHNKRQLSRIYPAGTRIGSTNYDPVPMWTVGCQVVALNYQTPDDAMQINRGLFGDNGACGYVLKPEFMRSFTSKATFSPEGFHMSICSKTFNIKIMSGFCLPKKEGDKAASILDPYVQLTMTGVPQDKRTFNTRIITDNGFHPIWDEAFEFAVTCPDLALFHLQVIDHETKHSDVIIAQYCLPFRCIQNGYRTVHLKTLSGEKCPTAKLFVHVAIS